MSEQTPQAPDPQWSEPPADPYAPPAQGGYGTPPASPGGVQPVPPSEGAFGAPPPAQDGFGAPAQTSYGAPAQAGYSAPAQGGYGAPAQGSYGAPASTGHGASAPQPGYPDAGQWQVSGRPSWQARPGDYGWAPPPAKSYIGWLAPFTGGGVTAGASLIGWAIIDGYGPIPGIAHQGVITLVLGLAAVALGFMLAVGLSRVIGFGLAALTGLGAIVVAIINLIDIPAQLGDSATIGIGLYLTLAGGIITLVGSLLSALKRPKPAPYRAG